MPATRETSKRALFLSPPQEEVKVDIAPEFTRRIEKSKRALFSPTRRLERSISNISSISNNSSLKRPRENDDDENVEPPNNKLAKYHGTVFQMRSSSAEFKPTLLAKATSENSMCHPHQLSASHKQKLLWAVSTALKKKSVTTTHERFNHYASVLAKVVKRLYLEIFVAKSESTSATMLR